MEAGTLGVPLSSRVMLQPLNPYLPHYTIAFAFSGVPPGPLYLLPCGLILRLGFPEGRQQARVPPGCRFVSLPVCFRLCLYAEGANHPAWAEFEPSQLDPLPFWFRCITRFHLLLLTTLPTITFR